MLDELPGATGLILWQSIRDVTLWADTPPAERSGLFTPSAERNRIAALLAATLDTELEQPLGLITAMVGQPGRVSAERVALACRRISQWAENNGHLATALAFAQAGAVTCPGNAAAAFKVGQIARRRAEYVRAETWFRRTIALARQEGDWTSYALGFTGLGTLYMQRGNLPKARAFQIRCLRAAKRHGLRDLQGGALHDLHVIATASDCADLAQHYAHEAFTVYGPRHPKIPRLAHDVGYFWLSQGYFAAALPVFEALLPFMGESERRKYLYPNIARAAGGAGDVTTFRAAWEEVWTTCSTEEAQGNSESMLELARGAASLEMWNLAEQAAQRAHQIANARSEARVLFEAEAVLDSIHSGRKLETIAVSADELVEEQVTLLSESFVLSLNASAAGC